MNVGKIIKKARLEKGYTQEELADRVGVKKSAVAKWENGRVSEIKRSNLKNLADSLGIKPTDLLGDIEENPIKTNITNSKIDLKTINQLNDTNISKVNKYASNLLNIQQMEAEPMIMAAHNDFAKEPDELEKMKKDMELLKRPT